MDESEIFDLSRNIVGDTWELQILIEDANEAVGELDYQLSEEEHQANVNRIYRAVSSIEEGIEVLTGVPAGKKDKNGHFPAGTVNALVYEKLKKYADVSSK